MSSYQSNQIKLINTSLIDPHPDNPRKNIGDVNDLAASIKTNGLLTPLSVVPNGERYRGIAGHRRLAACKQAGIGAVPCFVLQLGPLQQLEAMVTENCQREQLTVLEEADAIQGMLALGQPPPASRTGSAEAPTTCVTAPKSPGSRPRSGGHATISARSPSASSWP